MTNHETDVYRVNQAISCITNMNVRIKNLESENRSLQELIGRMEKRIISLSKQLTESKSKTPTWYIDRNIELSAKVEALEAKLECKKIFNPEWNDQNE